MVGSARAGLFRRNAAGMAWAKPGEFDDLVDAVHEAWLELGVTR